MIATAGTACIVCKHAKLKALVTGIVYHPIRGTDATFGTLNEN